MIQIDMKMPKCCIDCPILRENDWWGTYCPFVCEENNVNIKERIDRPSECPLKEIEESDDCVSRQAVLNEIYNTDGISNIYFRLADKIIALPPVKLAEKTGQWIKYVNNWVECSCCHELSCRKTNYCPNCGQPKISENKSCSNCKYWLLDKNDENRKCKYCFEMDEWIAESEE